jgi:hypothetical protein
MSRIFISHSTKDLDFVLSRLKPTLEREGSLAWCSSTDMRLAADWQKQIRSALAQTDWFLVVLSPDAQRSEWVQAETHWALEHLGGRVVPLMAKSCDPSEVHLRLGTIQYIDFRSDPEGASQRLLALIHGTPAESTTVLRKRPAEAAPEQTVVMKEKPRVEVALRIEPSAGPGYEQRLTIRSLATVGRAEDTDLRIADDCVSRRHARFEVLRSERGIELTLSDLGSSNGTYVNRTRVQSNHPLEVGDLIELGNARLRILEIA